MECRTMLINMSELAFASYRFVKPEALRHELLPAFDGAVVHEQSSTWRGPNIVSDIWCARPYRVWPPGTVGAPDPRHLEGMRTSADASTGAETKLDSALDDARDHIEATLNVLDFNPDLQSGVLLMQVSHVVDWERLINAQIDPDSPTLDVDLALLLRMVRADDADDADAVCLNVALDTPVPGLMTLTANASCTCAIVSVPDNLFSANVNLNRDGTPVVLAMHPGASRVFVWQALTAVRTMITYSGITNPPTHNQTIILRTKSSAPDRVTRLQMAMAAVEMYTLVITANRARQSARELNPDDAAAGSKLFVSEFMRTFEGHERGTLEMATRTAELLGMDVRDDHDPEEAAAGAGGAGAGAADAAPNDETQRDPPPPGQDGDVTDTN